MKVINKNDLIKNNINVNEIKENKIFDKLKKDKKIKKFFKKEGIQPENKKLKNELKKLN